MVQAEETVREYANDFYGSFDPELFPFDDIPPELKGVNRSDFDLSGVDKWFAEYMRERKAKLAGS